MKNFFITFCFIATSASASAQLEKDNMMTGGSIAGAGYSGGIFSLSLQPRVGYFVTDRLVTGLALNGNYSRFRYDDIESRVAHALSGTAQIFGRYYFAKKDDKKPLPRLVPFVEAGGGFFLSCVSDYPPFNHSQRFSGATAYGAVGASYFLTPSVALEGRLIGTYTQYSRPTSFVLHRERSLSGDFGFQIFLNRGKAKSSEVKATDR